VPRQRSPQRSDRLVPRLPTRAERIRLTSQLPQVVHPQRLGDVHELTKPRHRTRTGLPLPPQAQTHPGKAGSLLLGQPGTVAPQLDAVTHRQIAGHGHGHAPPTLTAQQRGPLPERAQAAETWFAEEYEPAVALLREAGLLTGGTETEAYLRLSCDRYQRMHTHSWDDTVVARLRDR